MEAYWFVVGLMFGSFGNVLIDRMPKGKSWMKGRSKCDACKRVLGVFDLVPVVSYLLLGGKCRYCHSPIPLRNLLVELIVGLSFGLVYKIFGMTGIGFTTMGLVWVTTVISVIDWESRLVSELLVGVWGIMVLVNQLIGNSWNLNASVWGVIASVGMIGGIWALSRGRAMGFGDVEIAFVMGWWLGWPIVGLALWVAFVVGGIVGVVKLVAGKAKLKSEIAFGPFLILGSWLARAWADKIWVWVFRY